MVWNKEDNADTVIVQSESTADTLLSLFGLGRCRIDHNERALVLHWGVGPAETGAAGALARQGSSPPVALHPCSEAGLADPSYHAA